MRLKSRVYVTAAGMAAVAAYVTAPAWLCPVFVERIDIIALGLLAFAALPWLAYCLEEFEIGGFKAKLRNIEEQAEAASETANAAREMIDDFEFPEYVSVPHHGTSPSNGTLIDSEVARGKKESFRRIQELATKYVSIRRSMTPGSKRTAKMTAIFR